MEASDPRVAQKSTTIVRAGWPRQGKRCLGLGTKGVPREYDQGQVAMRGDHAGQGTVGAPREVKGAEAPLRGAKPPPQRGPSYASGVCAQRARRGKRLCVGNMRGGKPYGHRGGVKGGRGPSKGARPPLRGAPPTLAVYARSAPRRAHAQAARDGARQARPSLGGRARGEGQRPLATTPSPTTCTLTHDRLRGACGSLPISMGGCHRQQQHKGGM